MTCEEVEPELVAYHFGLVSGEARAEIEAHLCGCGACVRAFIGVKRAIEIDEDGPRPSGSARARLRRAVADELRIGEARRGWLWWERPLAFTFAASATLAAMITMRALTSGPGAPPHALAHEARGEHQRQR